MKIDGMGDHKLVETQATDKKEEAKKAKPAFEVKPIVREQTESNGGEHQGQNKERLGDILDFAAKSREKKAKLLGKQRIRAIRSYERVAAFEDCFIFKGRFHREA